MKISTNYSVPTDDWMSEIDYRGATIAVLYLDEQQQIVVHMAESPATCWPIPYADLIQALERAKADLIDAIETDPDFGPNYIKR